MESKGAGGEGGCSPTTSPDLAPTSREVHPTTTPQKGLSHTLLTLFGVQQLLLHHVITQSSPSLPQSAALTLLFGSESRYSVPDAPVGFHAAHLSPTDRNQTPVSSLSLHIVALENAISSLNDLQRQLSSSSQDCLKQYVLLRDLESQIFQVASLIALSPVPALSFAIVDTTRLLATVIHLAAVEDTGSVHLVHDNILCMVTHLFGALASSYSGLREMMIAFEDANIEHAWLACFVGQLAGPSFIAELRRAPGIMSLVEEARLASKDDDVQPNFSLSRRDIGIVGSSLIDCWRICEIILQRRLWDFDEIRRHSDEIHHASIQLAKSCSYESGREALCASAIDTPLPKFFVALEKHSASQSLCEVARYLTVQLFQVALQYRHLLSSVGEGSLQQLYHHLEPSSIPAFTLAPKPNYQFQLRILLQLIDNPQLLLSDINYACQLSITLSTISTSCQYPLGCIDFIAAVSEARIPLSSFGLLSSALDEVAASLSAYTADDDSSPGQIRYPKPPFPLPVIERLPKGSKIFHRSDVIAFALRSATSLCNILEKLCAYCQSHSIRVSNSLACQTPPVRYVIRSSIKAIHVFRGNQGPCSLAFKADRAALRLLFRIAAVGFPASAMISETAGVDDIELVIQEVITEGTQSPKSFDTSLALLSSLCTAWKSDDILVNNRLSGAFCRCLRKFIPELSEMLLMWDGDCDQILWLMRNATEMRPCVWGEVISRVEFWTAKGHLRYLQRWLIVMRTLLVRQGSVDTSVDDLQAAFVRCGAGRSFEAWLDQIATLVSEADIDIIEEINGIRSLTRGVFCGESGEVLRDNRDIDDFIYVNSSDYLDELTSQEFPSLYQRPSSPSFWRGRLSPEHINSMTEDISALSIPSGGGPALPLRNGGGGKVYVQNEFRSAHGASRNTSRAPSVHVDDFNTIY